MPCEECKKSNKIQKIANDLVGLSDDEIVNLNCIIIGNKMEVFNGK